MSLLRYSLRSTKNKLPLAKIFDGHYLETNQFQRTQCNICLQRNNETKQQNSFHGNKFFLDGIIILYIYDSDPELHTKRQYKVFVTTQYSILKYILPFKCIYFSKMLLRHFHQTITLILWFEQSIFCFHLTSLKVR